MPRDSGSPDVGKRMRAVRGRLDQRGFSRQLSVSQQAISHYERGNVPASWDFLRRLSRDFNVSLNWLLVGRGHRELGATGPVSSLPDNRPPEWPRALLDQIAFEETDTLELLLNYYLLYLATEPADVKAHMIADLRQLVEALRAETEGRFGSEGEKETLSAVYDAMARDDRRALIEALIAAGEAAERPDRRRLFRGARKRYLSALSLARMEGWRRGELEAARRIGRTYRKEGAWHQADFFFGIALATFEGRSPNGGAERQAWDLPAEVRARTLLGYGHVAREQGEMAIARERYMAALRHAMETQDPGLRAEVYLDLACLAYREKDLRRAAEFLATGADFARASGEPRILNQVRLGDALVMRERGKLEEAEAVLRELTPRCHEQGDLDSYALASLNLAEVLADRGEIDDALHVLQSTAETAEARGNVRNLALRMLLRARLEAARGEDVAAGFWLLECMRYSRDHGLDAEFEKTAAFWTARHVPQLQPMVHAG